MATLKVLEDTAAEDTVEEDTEAEGTVEEGLEGTAEVGLEGTVEEGLVGMVVGLEDTEGALVRLGEGLWMRFRLGEEEEGLEGLGGRVGGRSLGRTGTGSCRLL